MTCTIRRMHNADLDSVYAIETDVHVTPWGRKILADCVLVGYECLVLEITLHKKTILGGYIICRLDNNSCHILNLCIAKSLQGKGYGRQLLEYTLNSLELIKYIHHVVLEVRPSNSIALQLYTTMGFTQVEIKQSYYKDGDQVEDAILLKKILHT